MSDKQLMVMWIGIGLIVVMCLFPPWVKVSGDDPGHARRGSRSYRFIFAHPRPRMSGDQIYLETSRLVVQCVAVALLTAGGICTLRVKGK